MQTGWVHKDHESQREFERLRNKAVQAQEQAQPAQPSTPQAPELPVQAPVKEYFLESPLGTIRINTQSAGSRVTWKIDRPLTVSVRDVPIATRQSPSANEYIGNTVNHINFVPTANIDIRGRQAEQDKVDVVIYSKDQNSLNGALSTVWIKDTVGDVAVGIGYDPGPNTYIQQVFLGPWGWQSAAGVATPYNLSGYSNNAIDDEWSMGTSLRIDPRTAWTRFGKVSKAGLYHITGTTQGMRYVSNFLSGGVIADWINVRLHYHLVRRTYITGETPYYRTNIYKTLDIDAWDLWGPGLFDTVEKRSSFISNMSSVPFSLQGTAQIWLEADDEVAHMVTFNAYSGEKRISYQFTYHAFEAILVADETTLDPNTQVEFVPVNDLEGPDEYHQMQFINV